MHNVQDFQKLVAIMARLRGPGGCAWDRAQNFASIAPYTIEEAYEVADAIAENDMEHLCEELGDLLLQVVFHAQMAAEEGHFTLRDVIDGIIRKMERRHPHVFGGGPSEGWEELKEQEQMRQSALDGVAAALPALMRAEKLLHRAERSGFAWENVGQAREKVYEELAEMDKATSEAERQEEAGDFLLAIVNDLRLRGISAESALRDGLRKFDHRFRALEKRPDFASATRAEKKRMWEEQKSQL